MLVFSEIPNPAIREGGNLEKTLTERVNDHYGYKNPKATIASKNGHFNCQSFVAIVIPRYASGLQKEQLQNPQISVI